jgi:single-stranded-DNA-specific exonuclease
VSASGLPISPPGVAPIPPSVLSPSRPPQRWILTQQNPEAAAALAAEARLPIVLAELLIARGITDDSAAFQFLNPEMSHLHDPLLMLGMETAVARLERAIEKREPVLLYGDYDVDGTTAVVLLKTAIEMLGGVVRFHVPHRLREGYGLQSSVLESAYAEGIRLVITVDTGMWASTSSSPITTCLPPMMRCRMRWPFSIPISRDACIRKSCCVARPSP